MAAPFRRTPEFYRRITDRQTAGGVDGQPKTQAGKARGKIGRFQHKKGWGRTAVAPARTMQTRNAASGAHP